jgi:hypothetical protein
MNPRLLLVSSLAPYPGLPHLQPSAVSSLPHTHLTAIAGRLRRLSRLRAPAAQVTFFLHLIPRSSLNPNPNLLSLVSSDCALLSSCLLLAGLLQMMQGAVRH